jgi:hypothetical protein
MVTTFLKRGDRIVFAYPDRSSADAPESHAAREAHRIRTELERLFVTLGVIVVGSIGTSEMRSGFEILAVVRDE